MSFKKLIPKTFFGVGGFALLALLTQSCASKPSLPVSANENRAIYTQRAENTLSDFEKKSRSLKGADANRLRAMLSDTRAEINRMEIASESSWENYKSGIDQRLYQLSTNLNGQ